MLRITGIDRQVLPAGVKVEGEIAGAHVSELARVVASALERAPHILLDLSGVTFVDHAGAVLLRTLRDRGVECIDGSSYVSGLVDGVSRGLGTGGLE